MTITQTSFGAIIPDYDFAVFNERAVRAGAGLLFVFVFGFSGWLIAATSGDFYLLRAFGAFFMFDMVMRLFFGQRFSPGLVVGGFFVRNQRPEWVEAKPKQTAWAIGFGMVVLACFMTGWLGLQGSLTLALCAVCMVFLFAEAAFGFCAGCWLHQKFSKDKPRLRSGDLCNYHPEGK